MEQTVLETKDVSKRFGGLTAVDNVSVKFDRDELTSIVGPNGAGKTTYFNLITGTLRVDEGQIFFAGEDITGLDRSAIAQRGLIRSYQIAQLFEGLTALENVKVGLRVDRSPFAFWRVDSEDTGMTERADAILNQVGLADQRDTVASTLNHGARRALEIAIAIGADPDLLLLDEPLAGMNREETTEIVELIEEINERVPIILVEHNVDVVMEVSDRVVVLHNGQKIADGPPDDIRTDDEVRRVYLGEAE